MKTLRDLGKLEAEENIKQLYLPMVQASKSCGAIATTTCNFIKLFVAVQEAKLRAVIAEIAAGDAGDKGKHRGLKWKLQAMHLEHLEKNLQGLGVLICLLQLPPPA